MNCDNNQARLIVSTPGEGYQAYRDTVYKDDPPLRLRLPANLHQPILGAGISVDFSMAKPVSIALMRPEQ